jgi:hypothetical protein
VKGEYFVSAEVFERIRANLQYRASISLIIKGPNIFLRLGIMIELFRSGILRCPTGVLFLAFSSVLTVVYTVFSC